MQIVGGRIGVHFGGGVKGGHGCQADGNDLRVAVHDVPLHRRAGQLRLLRRPGQPPPPRDLRRPTALMVAEGRRQPCMLCALCFVPTTAAGGNTPLPICVVGTVQVPSMNYRDNESGERRFVERQP